MPRRVAGTQETDPRKLTAQAEAAFARFLALRKAGEDVDFDAYCAERPDIAPLLRNLHQSWGGRADDSGRLDEFLKSRFGSEDDPGVALDGPPEDTEPAVKQRLKEIAARAPKTERYRSMSTSAGRWPIPTARRSLPRARCALS